MPVDILIANTKFQHAWTVILRYKVFSIEQGFDPKYDIDHREDESIHYLLRENEIPVATARYRIVEDKAKIEAVVVLKEYRKKGYATKLLKKIHDDLKTSKLYHCYLNSVVEIEPLYLKLGYTREGEMFKTPAGAPHYKMIKTLID